MEKQKYKQTEIGEIPEDWEVKEFGEVLKIKHGKSQKGVIQLNGDYPILATGGEIGRTNTWLYNKPSVLIGRKGTIDVPQYMETPFWTVDTLFYTEIKANQDPKFLFYKFQLVDWYSYNEASGVPSLNASTIEKIKSSFPIEEKEQTAIATVLSDTDELITSLDKLIAKKKAMKQGAMQELLTGKKRLPGFSGEWSVAEIDSRIDLLTGFPFPSNRYTITGTRLLRGSNVKRKVIDWSEDLTQFWADVDSRLKPYLLKEGDIVVAMDGSLVGKSFAQINNQDLPSLLLQRVARIRSSEIDINFLKEFICSDYFTKHCDSVKTSSAIPHISPLDIRQFKISIPHDKLEQTAIATVLSDMDSELESLEKKRDKYLMIKQGMMQQLLTGKIRLI